jgi:hypothetical protein
VQKFSLRPEPVIEVPAGRAAARLKEAERAFRDFLMRGALDDVERRASES